MLTASAMESIDATRARVTKIQIGPGDDADGPDGQDEHSGTEDLEQASADRARLDEGIDQYAYQLDRPAASRTDA